MKVIFSILMFLFCLNLQAQKNDKGIAKVRKINGLDIYIFSEPVAEYEVLDKISGFWNWGADEEGRSSLEDTVKTMIKRASKKSKKADKKGKEVADAIIIYDNNDGVMIRYLEDKK